MERLARPVQGILASSHPLAVVALLLGLARPVCIMQGHPLSELHYLGFHWLLETIKQQAALPLRRRRERRWMSLDVGNRPVKSPDPGNEVPLHCWPPGARTPERSPLLPKRAIGRQALAKSGGSPHCRCARPCVQRTRDVLELFGMRRVGIADRNYMHSGPRLARILPAQRMGWWWLGTIGSTRVSREAGRRPADWGCVAASAPPPSCVSPARATRSQMECLPCLIDNRLMVLAECRRHGNEVAFPPPPIRPRPHDRACRPLRPKQAQCLPALALWSHLTFLPALHSPGRIGRATGRSCPLV